LARHLRNPELSRLRFNHIEIEAVGEQLGFSHPIMSNLGYPRDMRVVALNPLGREHMRDNRDQRDRRSKNKEALRKSSYVETEHVPILARQISPL
jgi:hypothetical protein